MKKKIIALVLFALLIISMVGCGASSDGPMEETIANDGRTISSVDISNEEKLVYDSVTRIVYIDQYTYNGTSVYTLYLSENGLPYRYIDGNLVEVEY